MNTENKNNELPYYVLDFYNAKVDKIETLSRIFGIKNEKTKNRILNIACGFATDLIAEAVYNTENEYVGFDLSQERIDKIKEIADKLNLKNLKVYKLDFEDNFEKYGKFDYIICNNIYSYISREKQEKILKAIKIMLEKNSFALLSFNVYPFFKDVEILRDISRFRIKTLKKKKNIAYNDEIKYVRGALEFLDKFDNKNVVNLANAIFNQSDAYIRQNLLNDETNADYVYDFCKKLTKENLLYITDMNLSVSNRLLENEKIQNAINAESFKKNYIKEQYYDYIYNTDYRKSLITHVDEKNDFYIKDIYKNIKDMYVRAKYEFDKENQLYILNSEKHLKSEYTDIIKTLSEIYPNNMKVEQLLNQVGEDKKNYIINLMLNEALEMQHKEVNINTKKRKIKINSKLKNYIEVYKQNKEYMKFLDKELRVFADYCVDAMLLFDGKNSFEDILEQTKINSQELEEIYIGILISQEYEEA